MTEKIILKLGGSVVTDKRTGGGINYTVLHQTADVLAAHKDSEIILVHGAGTFGHPQAREHQLDKGLQKNNKAGIYITHLAVRELNDAVVCTLRAGGIEAIGIHPIGACTADNGRIISFDHRPIGLLSANGIMPVLHGDVAMDVTRGVCIVSGDQLVRYLAESLDIDRVGIATDVPGILDNGHVVPRITAGSADLLQIGGSSGTDVTGGMRGKLNELLDLSSIGIPSHIFHISRLGDFLDGKEDGGTRVV
jgi:isopentenyl phosphate kinase